MRAVGLSLADRWKNMDSKIMPVDETDIQILSILVRNSRETNSRIAELLHITEATVRRRIRALVSKGLIMAFTTRINFGAIENTVRAFMHLEVRADRLTEVVDAVRKHPRVASVHRVTGQHNILLVALFVSMAELQDFVDNFLRMDGISDTEIQVVMSSYKEELWDGI